MTGQISIRIRLLTGLITSLTAVFVAGCIALYWSQRDLLYNEFDRQLDQHTISGMREFFSKPPWAASQSADMNNEVPTGLLFIAIIAEDSGIIERKIPADIDLEGLSLPILTSKNGPEFSTIRDPAGKELRILTIKFGPPDRGPKPDRPPNLMKEFNMPPPPENGRMNPFSDPGPFRWYNPGPGRQEKANQILISAADMTPLTTSLRKWVIMLIAAGIIGELLVIGSVFLAVRRGLRPLRSLESEIARIDDSDLQHRVPVEGIPSELTPMVRQLNGLLSRLEDAFARERAFTASAAHEFRTPLAGIRTQIEVCLMSPRGGDEYRRTLEQCLGAAESLQRMVESLLDLARLDAGLIHPSCKIIDIPETLRFQWSKFEQTASSRGCAGKIETPDRIEFSTDQAILENILSNLMGNAAEYADAGGLIIISAEIKNGNLSLWIRNPASSLDVSDSPKLFDRFWRKDAARTNTGQHCGLGLAIVNRCVEALGGKLSADIRKGELQIGIILPPPPSKTRPDSGTAGAGKSHQD